MLFKMVEDMSKSALDVVCCALYGGLLPYDGRQMVEDVGNNGFGGCMMAWMMALDAV